jgi:hypothetical protein
MEDPETIYSDQDQDDIEEEDYPVSKRGMVRLLRSGPSNFSTIS